jgi:predicted phage tail protein
MIKVKFLGYMSNIFGSEYQVDVRSIDELFRSLRINFPDFVSYLTDAAARGAHYQIIVNGYAIADYSLNFILPAGAVISIVAVPAGAGGRGFRIIAGVALLGLGLAGVGFMGIKAGTLAITGAALLLGALRGQQKAPKDEKGLRSLMFSGPESTNKEGERVPLVYGDHLCGWLVFSQKITSTYRKA